MFWSAKFIFASEPSRSAKFIFLSIEFSVVAFRELFSDLCNKRAHYSHFNRFRNFICKVICEMDEIQQSKTVSLNLFLYFLYNNNSKPVSKKFKHAFWLMMKNKEMRKENVLLWPLFCAYFFVFHFIAKHMLEFRENMMFCRTVLKSSNYNYLSRRKVLFSRHRK